MVRSTLALIVLAAGLLALFWYVSEPPQEAPRPARRQWAPAPPPVGATGPVPTRAQAPAPGAGVAERESGTPARGAR